MTATVKYEQRCGELELWENYSELQTVYDNYIMTMYRLSRNM